MKKETINEFLNGLIEVLFHNIIYYIPSEMFSEQIFQQIEGELDDSFFDELTLADNFNGTGIIQNEDAIEVNQRLLEKKLLLEENVFKLLEKSKELTPLEFKIAIERYFDQLIFFLHITEWFTINLKHYIKKDIHFSIVGAYKFQYEYFLSHLKDVYSYFGGCVDMEKEHNFSLEKMIFEHVPDLISRYNSIETRMINILELEDDPVQEVENKSTDINDENIPNLSTVKKPTKVKSKPQISDKKVEKMILEAIFKLKID